MKKLLLLFMGILLFSCQSNRRHITVYKQPNHNETETLVDDWFFWYIIYNNDGSTVYYRADRMLDLTKNVAEVLADVDWKVTRGTPPEFKEEEAIEIDQIDTEMPEEAIAAIEQQQTEIEATETDSDTDSGNSSDSDSGSGDSGGDSGEGDGGGGDGGGGD